MSNKFTLESLNCPKCGASLEVFPNQDVIICEYCNNSFHINEKAPASSPTPPPKSVPPKSYSYNSKASIDAQKEAMARAANIGKTGAKAGIIITLVIFGFSGFMVWFGINKQKEQQKKIRNRIKNTQMQAKLRERDRKNKRWNDFKIENSDTLKKSQTEQIKKVVKKLKIPVWGNKKAKKTIYFFAKFTSWQMSVQKRARTKMKKFNLKYNGKFNFVTILLPRDNTKKFHGVEAMLEVLFEKGEKKYFKFYKKLLGHSYYHFGIKDMTKIAKKVGCISKEFSKALKTKVHADSLKLLSKLEDDLDLPSNTFSYVIGNSLYKTSTAMSRIDYVFENEFGQK